MSHLNTKEEIVKTIKALAKDLDARAEDIANDYNKMVRKIDIHTSIEVGCYSEWDITKHYGILTEKMIKELENIINNPNDAPKSMKAQASLTMPIKNEKSIVDEIGKAIKDSLNPLDIKLPDLVAPKVEIPNYIGADFGNGYSKSSYRNGGDG